VVDDLGPDNGRNHRGENIQRKFGKNLHHDRPTPRPAFDEETLRHIEGSTATDRWQFRRIPASAVIKPLKRVASAVLAALAALRRTFDELYKHRP
jgi:hypothetical protein